MKGEETERRVEVETKGMTEGGIEDLKMRDLNLKGLNFFVWKLLPNPGPTLEIVSAIITHFVWNDMNDKLLYT